VRGGRSQDCPGVKYHLVRGALDLVCSFINHVRDRHTDSFSGRCRQQNHLTIKVWHQEAQGCLDTSHNLRHNITLSCVTAPHLRYMGSSKSHEIKLPDCLIVVLQ
jgi:hypothetical protein